MRVFSVFAVKVCVVWDFVFGVIVYVLCVFCDCACSALICMM